MSNSYYNFTNLFVTGTTVKAAPLNSQFSAVQTGFATVEAGLSRAVKITGLTNGGEVTSVPSSFLLLDSSGYPTASATLPFAPNLGGYKITNLGNAIAGTDACNYGQMTAYVATIAFGSPNVLTVPSFTGNALKQLRLNSGGTALEFADVMPVTTKSGEVLASVAGTPTWAGPGANLLPDGSMARAIVDGDQHYWIHDGAGFPSAPPTEAMPETPLAFATAYELITQADYSPAVTVGQSYTASVYFRCATLTGSHTLFMRFLNGSNVAIGSDYTTTLSVTADGTYRRYSVTATAPATAVRVQVGIKSAVNSNGSQAYCQMFQLENGTFATPWKARNPELYAAERLPYFREIPSSTGVPTFRVATGGASLQAFLEMGGGTALEGNYAARFVATAAALYDGTDGTIEAQTRRFKLGKVAGFASVYGNGTMGATKTVNWYNGQKQSGTLDQNCTITLTAPDSDIVLDGLRLRLTFGGAGGWTVTFTSTATIRWVGNISPTAANGMITTAAQELECVFDWDGTRFVGRWTNL